MDATLEELFPEIRRAYLRATEKHFPAFLDSIDAGTPLNATPYIVGLTEFLNCDRDLCRARLVAQLDRSLNDLRNMGAQPQIVLVGGGFLGPSEAPKDLDCVVFYECETPVSPGLASWLSKQQHLGLDMRLIPLDTNPILVLKMALFFGALYGRGRGVAPAMRGLLLVDCAR